MKSKPRFENLYTLNRYIDYDNPTELVKESIKIEKIIYDLVNEKKFW